MTRKKKMGRPPLPKRERKRHFVAFKLDDAELKALDQKAKALGMTRSDFIRDSVKRRLRV